ncbi:MAG: cytochrome P450 [Planctomycetia bacterium]|nr:cytochrome P450 [Planctomycetia bacterium]
MNATAIRPDRLAGAARSWPEVRGHWLRGCLRQVQRDPLGLYHGAWREHGDYVRLRAFPGFYFYLLAHPDAIEHVLHANHKNYRKPDSANHSIGLLAGNGIIVSEGEFWRKQRRLMQPAFLRHQVVKLSSHMVESTDAFIRQWEQAEDGRTLDIVPEMMQLALRIASTSLFSTDISGDADAIGRAYRTAFGYVSLKMNGRLMFSPLWMPTRRNRRFRQAKALLDGVVLTLIARRRHEPAKNDVLDLLLAAQDEESGKGMTDEQLKDEALTLLTAGHETTGAALSWAWYLLATHPDVQHALHEQVSSHLQGRSPTAEDLSSMPLATAVFEETMRLYPPAWGIPRETIDEDEICGYPIPAKATIILMQDIVHRHPDFWTEPDKFDPQRFLPPHNAGRPKFAYFPFGGGPRICIGNHFAMLEGPLALAALTQRFQFTLVPNQAIVPDATFTLRPKQGVYLTVRKHT